MSNPRILSGAAILVAAHLGALVACSENSGNEDGSGGTTSSTGGGFSDGGSPSGGASPAGGSGGTAGACGTFGGEFDPGEGECGRCEASLEDFCDDFDCSLPDDLECFNRLPTTTIYRGCGYVRKEAYGDADDSWTYTWSEATGDLVYYHSTPGHSFSDACYPSRVAGEAPECDEWERACDGLGSGGAGGEGGGSP